MKTQHESIFSSKTLTYFLQLAETMSYTQAAQILGITQPALTQQIKKLEKNVGAPLFYSVGKKLHLSDAGYTMLDATHQIYETLNRATDEVQQATSPDLGEINVGILASIDTGVFFDFVVKFYERHPNVKLTIYSLTRKEIWEGLENNQLDLAIMYLPDGSIKNWKQYEIKTILAENLLFVHHNEKLKKRRKVKLKDTLNRPWVGYPLDFYVNNQLHEAFRNENIDSPDFAARFTQPEQLLQFAKKTDTYTALPDSFVASRQKEAAGLYQAQFEPAINFEMSFVYRKGKSEIPRITNFFQEFDQYLIDKDYISRLTESIEEK
ncbi:LysR family transcriptional regulator [Ligilactobacillus pabuli]|uniref:LysR family transcriptional regulator n=1 Tax=Ligilactobacillus pabuli TaxID=2886039 RepID=A0ABQ5JEA7_9LACO|nr:LysR family transcriptional regulator [Ligilactobacillus pabuli]GKS80406.1 LysR family transcriptional regulator [Ligilactobacillus pabuli]